jgi:hypothetical protein
MRALRLAVLVVVAIAVGGGVAACSRTVEGTGTLAADATGTAGPTPTETSAPSPTETTDSPTPTPSPTPDQTKVRRLALCVVERAAITSTNASFNKAKSRDSQISALRKGATTILGNLRKSKLPTSDGVYRSGKAVLDQLNALVKAADSGRSPSTTPYNKATTAFSKVCSSL